MTQPGTVVPGVEEDEQTEKYKREEPVVAHQLAEYGAVLDEPDTAYGIVQDTADDPAVHHQLAEYGEEVAEVDRQEVSPGAFYDSKVNVAEHFLAEGNTVWRGMLEGATVMPQAMAVIYDTCQEQEDEHVPYSIRGIMNETRDDEKGWPEYIGNGIGMVAGGVAVYAAPQTFILGSTIDALDAGDRKVAAFLQRRKS